MRTISERTITRKADVVDLLTCDVCGRHAPQGNNPYSADAEWGTGNIKDEITVSRRHGEIYPENDMSIVDSFDLCPTCWDKVEKFIKALGAKMQSRRIEW